MIYSISNIPNIQHNRIFEVLENNSLMFILLVERCMQRIIHDCFGVKAISSSVIELVCGTFDSFQSEAYCIIIIPTLINYQPPLI